MKFSEALTEVMSELKRPDKQNIARRELNAAITWYCLDCDYARDFEEATIAIDPANYIQTLPLSSFERYRKIKYVRYSGIQRFLTPLADSEMFKPCTKTDKYYIVGDNINLSLQYTQPNLIFGWMKFPPILDGSIAKDNFWLLDVAPWAPINKAIAAVFASIGDEKSANYFLGLAKEAYAVVRKDLGTAAQ